MGAVPEGERNAKAEIARTRTVSATARGSARAMGSATATVLTKIYIFRCSKKSDLLAITGDPTGGNLPLGACTGHWTLLRETEVERGGHIAGFVSRDLFRDLDRQGFHIASGVRVTASASLTGTGTIRAVADALSTANTRTRFFTTDADA
jgi:hypothetical protein